MQGEKTGHSEYSLYKETYSYDGLGRLTDTYLNSVTATTSQTLTDQRIYDGASRVTQQTVYDVEGGTRSLTNRIRR